MANKNETTDPADKVNALAEEDDGDIIDLTEIVEPPVENDDDVIELTDIVKEDVDETRPTVETAADGAPRKESAESADAGPGEIAIAETSAPVSREQVQTAVEKVVREIYAEKIETMLFDVINTVVKDEIGRLKEILEQEVRPDD